MNSTANSDRLSQVLIDHGCDERIVEQFESLDHRQPLRLARVIQDSGAHYRIIDDSGEHTVTCARSIATRDARPVVGDWVAIAGDGYGGTWIAAVLPRRSRLSRAQAGTRTGEQVLAANLNQVLLVMGLDRDFNLRRLERLVAMVWHSGASPVVVLTKTDVSDRVEEASAQAESYAPGVAVIPVCATRNEGMGTLQACWSPRQTIALIGSSGAGKSTLINSLAGKAVMATGAVRSGDDRGRHTTTHRQLVRLPDGALLIDNPGIREIQLWATGGALGETFSDVLAFARSCRFGDCRHQEEPGCGVLGAIKAGRLDPERLAGWRKLNRELEQLELRRDVARRRRSRRKTGKLYKSIQEAKRRERGR